MTSDKDQAQPTQEPEEPVAAADGPEVEGQLWTVGEALGRLGGLAHDSREGLRTEEQALAGYGVTWTSDPAQDQALAEELQAARQRRQRGGA